MKKKVLQSASFNCQNSKRGQNEERMRVHKSMTLIPSERTFLPMWFLHLHARNMLQGVFCDSELATTLHLYPQYKILHGPSSE